MDVLYQDGRDSVKLDAPGIAHKLIQQGLSPVPIPTGKKGPAFSGWLTREFSPDDFEVNSNIGVKLGSVSGNLIDVDLDSTEAAELAGVMLPATATGGRDTRPKSHYFYRVTGDVPGNHRFEDPEAEDRVTLEFRGSGLQTVVYGIHPDGDRYHGIEGEITEIDGSILYSLCEATHREILRRRGHDAKPTTIPLSSHVLRTHDAPALADRIKQASKYLESVPEAVTGQGGHDSALWAARVLVRGFSLPVDVATDLFTREYNPRCRPPWNTAEIAHKIDEAANKPFDKPDGWLVNERHHLVSEPLGQFALSDIDGQTSFTKTIREIHRELPAAPVATVDPFRPFPVEAFPRPLSDFIIGSCRSIGCDLSFMALPVLAVLASAIGTTRKILLKRGWAAPSIMWTATVGDSGNQKSPPYKLAVKPVYERQRQFIVAYKNEMDEHAKELLRFERELSLWKKGKGPGDDPPDKPEPPVANRCLIQDTTIEALVPILMENQRGVLLARDELSGWLGSFDRYANGKGGGESGHWLSMYNGEGFVVDRKTGLYRTIYVPASAVSLTGSIQPGTLNRLLGAAQREAGMLARLHLCTPPRTKRKWTDSDIDPVVEEWYAGMLNALFSLQSEFDEEGNPRPIVLGAKASAKVLYQRFYDQHAEELVDMIGDLAAAWSKLEETAARLALVIHMTRWACDDPTLTDWGVIDVTSMKAGISITEWFKYETRRTYAILGETEEERSLRRLIEKITRKGGRITPRELSQGDRQFPTVESAETALQALAKAGFGSWEVLESGTAGGRPSRVFRVSESVCVYETSKNAGFLGVSSTDHFENATHGGTDEAESGYMEISL